TSSSTRATVHGDSRPKIARYSSVSRIRTSYDQPPSPRHVSPSQPLPAQPSPTLVACLHPPESRKGPILDILNVEQAAGCVRESTLWSTISSSALRVRVVSIYSIVAWPELPSAYSKSASPSSSASKP